MTAHGNSSIYAQLNVVSTDDLKGSNVSMATEAVGRRPLKLLLQDAIKDGTAGSTVQNKMELHEYHNLSMVCMCVVFLSYSIYLSIHTSLGSSQLSQL